MALNAGEVSEDAQAPVLQKALRPRHRREVFAK